MAEDIPHLTLPIAFAGPRYSTVDQDSSSEVACCVQAIVSFAKGFRAERPDFGIDDPVFDLVPLEVGELESDIRNWEPRADLLLEEEDDVRQPGNVRLTIHVSTMGG